MANCGPIQGQYNWYHQMLSTNVCGTLIVVLVGTYGLTLRVIRAGKRS